MNGLAVTIIVGQLPKLCGFSTDADGFVDELREFVTGLDQRNATALAVGLGTLACCSCCRGSRGGPGGPRRRGRRDGRHGGRSTSTSTTVGAAARRGCPGRRCRGPAGATSSPLLIAAARHHPRLADGHHRHLDELRRAPRRRGRRQPGDDRDRLGEPGRRPVPGLRRVDERFADGRGRAVGREEPAHRGRRRGSVVAPAAVLPARCSPICRRRRWRPSSSRRRCRWPTSTALVRFWRCAGARSRCRWSRPPASCSSGCSRASSIAIALSILLFFERSWWPDGEVLGERRRRRAGTAGDRRRPSSPTASSCTAGRRRCSSPTPGMFRQQVRQPRPRAATALGRAPVRGDHRHRRHRRRHARAARHRAERAGRRTSPSSSCADRLHDLVYATASSSTLDRDHFYGSIDDAMLAIENEEAGESSSPE